MPNLQQKIQDINHFKDNALIRILTLGQFKVWREGVAVGSKDWGRDKTIQLIQYLISNRHRNALHRENIMDSLWEDGDERDFKVALHGINKVLEPDRPSRSEPKYIIRQGVSYQINLDEVWIDVEALEKFIIIGNESLGQDIELAKSAYKQAIEIYQGIYLPNRVFEDWSSEEREKIQILILGAFITLGEILIDENPIESIRLAHNALSVDPTWEDAYRLQMSAYLQKGNRPQAIKTYEKCASVLKEEYGIEPLPETKKLLQDIMEIH